MTPFYLAFPVTDVEATRSLFCEVLGCTIERITDQWIDFNFFGYQVTAHLVERGENEIGNNIIDGKLIPARHFGAILDWQHWHDLANRLQIANIEFLIAPNIRFKGELGE